VKILPIPTAIVDGAALRQVAPGRVMVTLCDGYMAEVLATLTEDKAGQKGIVADVKRSRK
jgi:hypothetical protein